MSCFVGNSSFFPSRFRFNFGPEMKPLRVGLIGYDGVQALDIIGPSDAFTIAEIEGDNGQRRTCYEVIIVGITNKPFRAESGVSFQPHTTLGNAPTLANLII